MIELAKHIEILLLDNDCVIVPDFGGFMAHHVDAVYDEEEGTFIPPRRTLGFNPQLYINDSLLAQSYVEAYDVSYPDAIKRIESEVAEMRQTINNEGYYELPDIGVIRMNGEGNYDFEPCLSGILTPEIYALTSFELPMLEDTQAEPEPKVPVNPFVTQESAEDKTITMASLSTALVSEEDNKPRVVSINLTTLRNVVTAAIMLCIFVFAAIPMGENLVPGLQQSAIDTGVLQRVMPKVQTTQPGDLEVIKVKNNQVVRTGHTASQETAVRQSGNNDEVKVNEVPVTKILYAVVFASKVAKKNAESFISSLKKQGVTEARLLEGFGSNKVVSGNFKNLDDANAAAQKFREQSDAFKDVWVIEVVESKD